MSNHANKSPMGTTTNMDIEKARKLLKNISIVAEHLHQRVVDDHAKDTLKPIHWLANEDIMRMQFREMKNDISDIPLGDSLEKSAWWKYMKFMDERYPHGFGNRLKHCIDNDIQVDSAELFLECLNKQGQESYTESELNL